MVQFGHARQLLPRTGFWWSVCCSAAGVACRSWRSNQNGAGIQGSWVVPSYGKFLPEACDNEDLLTPASKELLLVDAILTAARVEKEGLALRFKGFGVRLCRCGAFKSSTSLQSCPHPTLKCQHQALEEPAQPEGEFDSEADMLPQGDHFAQRCDLPKWHLHADRPAQFCTLCLPLGMVFRHEQ